MDITTSLVLLGLLIIAIRTPIQTLTQKTVQKIKTRRLRKKELIEFLGEVTRKVQDEVFRQHRGRVGVARGIASPNASDPYVTMPYTGDTITFIICEDCLTVFTIKEKNKEENKFRIWYNKGWYYKDQNTGVIFALHGKGFWIASKLSRTAAKKHEEFQEMERKKLISKLRTGKKEFCAEVACNS